MKATSKLRPPHPTADSPLLRMRGRFSGDKADMPLAYRVKVQKCAGLLAALYLEGCNFTTICDRKGYKDGHLPKILICTFTFSENLLLTQQNDGQGQHVCFRKIWCELDH